MTVMEGRTVKVGDIYYASWGYDQTNIDFFEVVGLSKSGQSVRLRAVQSRRVGSNGYQDQVVPMPGEYRTPRGDHATVWSGKTFTRRIREGSDYVNLTTYAGAWLWDGSPKSETASGFGH